MGTSGEFGFESTDSASLYSLAAEVLQSVRQGVGVTVRQPERRPSCVFAQMHKAYLRDGWFECASFKAATAGRTGENSKLPSALIVGNERVRGDSM